MSPPGSPYRADRGFGAGQSPPHACEVSVGRRRGWRQRSRLDRTASRGARLSGGGCPGGRAWSAPAPRAGRGPAVRRRGHSSRPLVAHPPALNRSGCCDDCTCTQWMYWESGLPARMPCDDCTEWMYWVRRTGLPAREPCRVRSFVPCGWLVRCVCGGSDPCGVNNQG